MDPASAERKRHIQRRLDRAAALFVQRVQSSDTVRKVVEEALDAIRNGDMADTQRIRLLGKKYGLTEEEMERLRQEARRDVAGEEP